MASLNANPSPQKINAGKFCGGFCCKNCKTTLGWDHDFIQTRPPIAIANTIQCLVQNVGNVNFGPVQRETKGRIIGLNPFIRADITHIYCVSCQTFVGWKIARQYNPHPIVHEGQYILLLGIGGAVTSFNKSVKKSHIAEKI